MAIRGVAASAQRRTVAYGAGDAGGWTREGATATRRGGGEGAGAGTAQGGGGGGWAGGAGHGVEFDERHGEGGGLFKESRGSF